MRNVRATPTWRGLSFPRPRLARPSSAAPATSSLAGWLFMITGLLVIASTFAASGSSARNVEVVRAVNAVAVLAGGAMVVLRQRTPRVTPHLAVFGGVVLITMALDASGGGVSAVAYGSVYALAPVYGFFILSRRAAMAHMVVTLCVGIPSLARQPGVGAAEQLLIWGVAALLGGAVSAMARLAERAETDSLTGLANRRGSERALEQAIAGAGRHRRPVVAVLDLDHFKAYNDDRGRAAGDRLLVEIARAWLPHLPAGATMGRQGGDDFVIVVPDAAPDAVASLCDALRALLPQGPTCSAGVAQWEVGETCAMLFNRTDLAVHTAKREGRARTHQHIGAGDDGEAIRAGLEAGEFVVHFQPIVAPATGVLVGAEALIRWQHPQQGMIPPDSFIPGAERSGAIIDLGRFVLTQACAAAAAWPSTDGVTPYIAVNASGAELQDPIYASTVEAALAASGLAPQRLVLELVETHYDIESLDLVTNLHRLRSLGIRTAMDDFGVGHSSLDRLRRSGVDILKIDKSFASDITGPEAASPLISAILAMADALSLRVVVEGVETAGQAHWLALNSDAYAQGWHFGRPAAQLTRPGGTGEPLRPEPSRRVTQDEYSSQIVM